MTRNTWVATFSYAQSEFPFEQGPQQLGYTEFTFDYTAEFRDVYRSNPGLTFPTDGDAGTASYCNGTAISVGDQPMSVLRYFTSLEITEVVAYNTMDDRISRIIAARGKRNSSIFRGAAVGTVVYRGARATRIAPNKFSVTHSFLQDDWYHMIQVAPVGSDGRVRLDLFQGQNLATAVMMSTNIIKALGFMAPPKLIHLYMDNFWMAIGNILDCIDYHHDAKRQDKK
ncbi:MAG: hypothetical protein EBW16_03430 [Burkholderiaceae bacterium]|nr:hypothetical protein [Burkholderiaceae bacterium]